MPLVYLDTGVFIRGFELDGFEAEEVRMFFSEVVKRPSAATTSELTIAELLAPIKIAGAMSLGERRSLYLSLFDDGDFIEVEPVTRTILLETASLRQIFPQRLPDAIHMATALCSGCSFFMSPDGDARRLPPALKWVEPTAAGIAIVLEALRA